MRLGMSRRTMPAAASRGKSQLSCAPLFPRAVRGRFRAPENRRVTAIAPPHTASCDDLVAARIREHLGPRSIVLVGMMGSGKTSIGKRLAARLDLPFVDADSEIESAAGMTISDIFALHGEAEFRAGEVKVMARLLESGPQVLATGGGAFMNATTRANIAAHGVSIWLKADFDVLMRRVKKRTNRPLLQTENPEAALKQLIEARYPTYALADLTVDSHDAPHEAILASAIAALDGHLARSAA